MATGQEPISLQAFGRMQGDLESLKEDSHESKKFRDEVLKDLGLIKEFVAETRGNKKYLYGLVMVTAALGAMIDRVIGWKFG